MKYKLCDYKGKYFTLQDELTGEDTQFFPMSDIDKKGVTDDWLEAHVKNCRYFGIPAYRGNDNDLTDRINAIENELDKNEKDTD